MCRIHATLGNGFVGALGFTRNSSVIFKIFGSQGGNLMAGPHTRTTDASGSHTLDPTDGYNLAPGRYIEVTDVATGITRSLVVADLLIEAVDLATDTVSGTSAASATVQVMASDIQGQSVGPVAVQPNESGAWSVDFATQAPPFDITTESSVAATVVDDEGDATSASPLPGCPAIHAGQTCKIQASVSGYADYILAAGFSPRSAVTATAFRSGNKIFGPASHRTDRNGEWSFPTVTGDTPDLDLHPGDVVEVTDEGSSVTKRLTLTNLSITEMDIDADTITGITSPGDRVIAGGNPGDAVVADVSSDGSWTASFAPLGFNLTTESDPLAWVADGDGDVTYGYAPVGCPGIGIHHCTIASSIEGDWISAEAMTPYSEVQFELFDAQGTLIFQGSETTGVSGTTTGIEVDWPTGIDLIPGMEITARDVATGNVQRLTLGELFLDTVDPDTDTVSGRAPAGTTVSVVGAARGLEPVADSSGAWVADFGTITGYDIGLDDQFNATIYDADGDATQDSLGSPLPDCVEDADTICGSAGEDTARTDEEEVLTGPADDIVHIIEEGGTEEVIVDTGTDGDGVVVHPGGASAAGTSGVSAQANTRVVIMSKSGHDLILLPQRSGGLVILVVAGDGNDRVSTRSVGRRSGTGRYRLDGGRGVDMLTAGNGNDTLIGGGGNDRLDGSAGDDTLRGGGGGDLLIGGAGTDTCHAGPGDETRGCERVIRT